MGNANNRSPKRPHWDPQNKGLHSTIYQYMANPPVMTYGTRKTIVATLKKIGAEVLHSKVIRVGATMDPRPEFAKSNFKYKRHHEICGGGGLGQDSFIDAASMLHGDTRFYVAFPVRVTGKREKSSPVGCFLKRPSKAGRN